MSKPFKRDPGSREIPAWKIPAGGEQFTDIIYETAEGIAKLTINRPEVRNAFRPQTLFELEEAFSMARDDETVGVIILTGAGSEAFCSGGDINVRGDDGYIGSDTLGKKGIGRLNVLDLQIQIRRLPKPVVAMVAGWAVGGGHVVHVVCDLTIAADNAKFGQPEVKLGLIPGYGGTQRLVQLIGKGKALELLMTADNIDASAALNLGLANHVVAQDVLIETSKGILNKIRAVAPVAVAKVIESVNAHFKDGVDGSEAEVNAFAECVNTTDFVEGTTAFVEKRKANFTGK